MANSKYTQVLSELESLQAQPLRIISLSEHVYTGASQNNAAHGRSSDVSALAAENEGTSPASLEADLRHYKELFSKLRFSYQEQVTKEKFLRSIVGDPPLIVEPAENLELESQLAEVKTVLKEQKQGIARMVGELEERGRKLARRYETISLQTTLLSSLPPQIDYLQSTIESLRPLANPLSLSKSPNLSLPLHATTSLLSERVDELAQLNQQLKTLQQALPRKTRELEKVENELKVLEMQRDGVVLAAREAVKRKEEGGWGDGLEGRGRWLKEAEAGLREMLEIRA